MPKATLILLLTLLEVPPVFAAKNLTVEQLGNEVASLAKTKDSKAAGRLYELQLTERLSATRLATFESELPGPESRRALVALADRAEFLDPPPAEIPSQAAPNVAEQRAIIAKSIAYVEATLRRLPNLFARRDTIRYEDTPAGVEEISRESMSGTVSVYQPLHPVSRTMATVLYRDGKEIVQKQAAQGGTSTPTATGMVTFGEFGPIFSVLYGDLPKGNLRWAYWEQGKTGLDAVFRFDVAKRDSHYLVRFCCISGQVFQAFPAYHGEITIDPSKGTILRVTLIAEMSPTDPVIQSQLMVQYGPVELGGKSYFCPHRSIAVTRAPAQSTQNLGFGIAGVPPHPDNRGTNLPLQTMLNEVAFDNYHLFRGDVQILTANNAEGESQITPGIASSATSATSAPNGQSSAANETAPPSPPAGSTAQNTRASNPASPENQTTPAVAPQLNASSTGSSASPTIAPPAPTSITGAKSEASNPAFANTATPPSLESAAAPGTSDHEVAVLSPVHIPQVPLPPPMSSGNSGFSLSVNARLVDVDVTATDRKGRPITSLTRDDFAIYDDGRKQPLASFSHVSGNASPIQQTSVTTAQPALYTNRPPAVSGAHPVSASAPESSTILLLDPTSLDFADLNYAREQILKFLNRVPNSEPVGLYVRTGSGFRILAEETTDHAALVSALGSWMPTAKDLAVAQEAERRNRQQFDTVGANAIDAPDLNTLNGNMIMPGIGAPVADPKLAKEGGTDPARESFGVLVGVASHLNAIPGHKNLVWVASDNVLENWSDQTPGGDVGSSRLGSSGLRTQEALNDAHVSIYPLDASQLETAGANASLENAGAELNASAETLAPHANDEIRMKGGRTQAEMLQDIDAIQPAIQQAAQATGGRAFPRASDMIHELDSVIEDGHAAYLLSFAPDTPPDGKYHHITVTVPGRRGIKLQYREGYLYTQEPTALKQRIQQAIWQSRDETGIGLNARWAHASQGAAISISIAAGDVNVKKQQDRWMDKLDIFLVQLDGTGTHATVKDQTLSLNLTSAAYQNLLRNGIPFAEYVEHGHATGTVRVIVVDENSGRIGSVTLPAMLERASR